MTDSTQMRKLRPLLLVFASIGFLTINIPFLYYAIFKSDIYDLAVANRVAQIFMGEAMLLMIFFAILIARMGWRKPGWIFFVIMSFVGSLAFSIPLQMYLMLGKKEK